MYSIIYTIGMIILWVINLFNGTGMGTVYKTTEIASIVALVIFILIIAFQTLKEGDLYIPRRYFYTLLPMAVVFIGSSVLNGQMLSGLEGFWVYLIIFILSRTRPNAAAIRLTAVAYGLMGLVVLYIFNFQTILSGWNPNSIAMIGLFSFVIFTIPFYGMRDWRSFVFLPLIGAAYVFLIWPTESRSCIVAIVADLLLVLRIIPFKKVASSPKGLLVILLVPLIVAISVSLFSKFGDMSGLTQWSIEKFGKPIFNKRDDIWIEGFVRLTQAPFLGTARFNVGYWHNSAMACLTAFGTLGYIFWTRMFHMILKDGIPYVEDTNVIGSMVAFSVIFCQQSVELGIFAPNPSLLPYVVLGIMLGRANYLRSEAQWRR